MSNIQVAIDLLHKLEKVKAQRDELLEALEEIFARSDDMLSEWLCEFEIRDARSAIAKAKGE